MTRARKPPRFLHEELERAEEWLSRGSSAGPLASKLVEEATAIFSALSGFHRAAPSDSPIR
jgi:hypothetical protein